MPHVTNFVVTLDFCNFGGNFFWRHGKLEPHPPATQIAGGQRSTMNRVLLFLFLFLKKHHSILRPSLGAS